MEDRPGVHEGRRLGLDAPFPPCLSSSEPGIVERTKHRETMWALPMTLILSRSLRQDRLYLISAKRLRSDGAEQTVLLAMWHLWTHQEGSHCCGFCIFVSLTHSGSQWQVLISTRYTTQWS